MKKRSWTALFTLMSMVCIGLNTVVFADSNPDGTAFVKTEKALSNAITTLNHEPNVSNTGFAGSLNKETLKVIFSVRKAVTENQANAIVNVYLNRARSFDGANIQFIQPYKFEVDVYKGNLGDTLLLTGVKSPGSNRIVWNKKS